MNVLRDEVKTMLDAAWREPGFCVPNPTTYPFQWLWDSCFHAIIWAELGDDRAITELQNVLAHQSDDGFVPHVAYWSDPTHHAGFWGREMTSSITQPPMYGHAAAQLVRRGFTVPAELLERCRLGLSHLLRVRPRNKNGLVPVFHPWETGCDDSLRWDDWRLDGDGGPSWYESKGEMVASLEFQGLSPVGSDLFSVTSVGFNALLAWNVAEMDSIGEAGDMVDEGRALAENLATQWSDKEAIWTDSPKTECTDSLGGHKVEDEQPDVRSSGAIRTLDSLLPLLVDPRPEAFTHLAEGGGFSSPFGPRGTHKDEPKYDPQTYWRGPCWPQLAYLLVTAAESAGETVLAQRLQTEFVAGATQSGLSEYWNPESGAGLGAIPQSWAGLAIVES